MIAVATPSWPSSTLWSVPSLRTPVMNGWMTFVVNCSTSLAITMPASVWWSPRRYMYCVMVSSAPAAVTAGRL